MYTVDQSRTLLNFVGGGAEIISRELHRLHAFDDPQEESCACSRLIQYISRFELVKSLIKSTNLS